MYFQYLHENLCKSLSIRSDLKSVNRKKKLRNTTKQNDTTAFVVLPLLRLYGCNTVEYEQKMSIMSCRQIDVSKCECIQYEVKNVYSSYNNEIELDFNVFSLENFSVEPT